MAVRGLFRERSRTQPGVQCSQKCLPPAWLIFGTVPTGQLVWNRHKPQLRQAKVNGELPIVWAESVTLAGFSFSAERRKSCALH